MYTQKNAQPHKNAELSATRNTANPTTCFWAEPCHDQGPLTMSSREIADLTGKELSHVNRDIRAMLDSLVDDPELDHVREDKDGRGYTTAFHLGRELTYTLLSGYSVPLRRRVVARWQELEAQVVPALPNFADPVAAARAWADAKEGEQRAAAQLAQAAPMVEFVARYVQAESGSMGLRQVCKVLKAKQPDLTAFLLDRGLMYRTPSGVLTPKAEHIHNGRFEAKTGTAEHGDSSHAYVHYKFTAKGLEWIARLWDQHQATQQTAED